MHGDLNPLNTTSLTCQSTTCQGGSDMLISLFSSNVMRQHHAQATRAFEQLLYIYWSLVSSHGNLTTIERTFSTYPWLERMRGHAYPGMIDLSNHRVCGRRFRFCLCAHHVHRAQICISFSTPTPSRTRPWGGGVVANCPQDTRAWLKGRTAQKSSVLEVRRGCYALAPRANRCFRGHPPEPRTPGSDSRAADSQQKAERLCAARICAERTGQGRAAPCLFPLAALRAGQLPAARAAPRRGPEGRQGRTASALPAGWSYHGGYSRLSTPKRRKPGRGSHAQNRPWCAQVSRHTHGDSRIHGCRRCQAGCLLWGCFAPLY